MLVKKLLLSLCAVGVVGGTGTGIYYLKQQNKQEVQEAGSASSNAVPASPQSPTPTPNVGAVNTVGAGSSGTAQQNTVQPSQQTINT